MIVDLIFSKLGANLHQKGFTLIELIITIAIIGILASIAIPQFTSYKIKSSNANASSDLKNIMLTEELYYTKNQTYIGLTAIAGYQASLPNLTGIHLSTNVCAKVINATSSNYTVQTEHLNGDKSFSNSQSSTLSTTNKAIGVYSIGC